LKEIALMQAEESACVLGFHQFVNVVRSSIMNANGGLGEGA
jgi:hypothetical protein